MSQLFRIAAQVILVFVLASCSSESVGGDHSHARLEGVWSGAIAIEDDPTNLLNLRLFIEGDTPRVEVMFNGTFVEALQNPFQINQSEGNAVLYATHSGKDDDGTWVESWAIMVAPRSSDELLVVWARLVNNLDMPPDQESSKFSVTGSGVFSRVPDGG